MHPHPATRAAAACNPMHQRAATIAGARCDPMCPPCPPVLLTRRRSGAASAGCCAACPCYAASTTRTSTGWQVRVRASPVTPTLTLTLTLTLNLTLTDEASLETLPAGATLLRQGSQADALYVVRDGYVLCQPKEAQRAQLEAKLVEWEATFRRTHEREPTAADKQRSSQHKELTKLIADLDRFISAAESGAPPPGGQLAGEREAERGKLKSKMRRWDRDFERERGRRPREEDRAASEEFLGLRSRLQVLDESGDVSSRSNASAGPAVGGGGGLSAAAAAAAAAAGSDGLLLGGVSEAAHRLNPGGWWGGGEYYQLVISRVASRDAAHGFDQVRDPNPNPNP